MDLPHLNVLTKIDNLASYPPLPLSLDFYTEARSLDHLLPYLEEEQKQDFPDARSQNGSSRHASSSVDSRPNKFTALNEAIVELVEDFGLVGYETLAVEDRGSMLQLLHAIDRAGGYAFGAAEGVNETIWEMAVREGGGGKMEVRDIEERWVGRRYDFDELERKMWEVEGKAVKRKAGVPEAGASGSQVKHSTKDEEFEEITRNWKSPEDEDGIKIVRS